MAGFGEGEGILLNPAKLLLRLERARRRLLATDPGNKEKLLAASRKVDKLVVEYYRTKLMSKVTGS